MRRILIAGFFILSVFILGCHEKYTLPAIGQAIYCPHCNLDLAVRISGTSRTSFDPEDYFPLFYDTDYSKVVTDGVCPHCGKQMVDSDEYGEVTRVYYRDFQW